MDPSYPLFSIFAFLSFILVLVPLPWHLHAWNSGTCLYMIWTALGLLNLFINSIIWRDNAIDWSPHWCDICAFYKLPVCVDTITNCYIATRIVVGVSVALPAASLCINRRLYKIASCQTTSFTPAHVSTALECLVAHNLIFCRNAVLL